MDKLTLFRRALERLGALSMEVPQGLCLDLWGEDWQRSFALYAHEGYLIKVDAKPPYPLLTLGALLGNRQGDEEAFGEVLVLQRPPDLALKVTQGVSLLLGAVVEAVAQSRKGKAYLCPRVPPVYLLLGGGIRVSPEVLDLFLPPRKGMTLGEALAEACIVWGEEWDALF